MTRAVPSMVILHPSDLSGEDEGLRVQHVLTFAELLDSCGWNVLALDRLDPRLGSRALSADVVVVQMLAAPEVEGVIRQRRARGLRTVFEITDNFLALDWVRSNHPLRSPLVRQSILFHAWLADAVQVYAPGLREVFAPVNSRIDVLDPYVPMPESPPEKPPGFVFGWGGTRSHERDLAAIAPAVAAFCRRHQEARFAFMGDSDMFERHFGALPRDQVHVQPFGPHEEYLRFVSGLHVGLAPLLPTPFNAARTDTRFGTYAALGAAGVLQDGPVYGRHRDRARLFGSPRDLEAILEELFRAAGQVRALAQRARDWVRAERGAAALARQRVRFYDSLLPERAERGQATDPLAASEAARARYRLAQATRGEPAEALATCTELLAEQPGYDQARLHAARVLEAADRPRDALRVLEDGARSPVYADLVLEAQARLAAKAGTPQAGAYADAIVSPFRRARLRAGGCGDAPERMLRHHPYDYFALAAAVRRLRRTDPDAPALGQLFERLCLVSPESVPPERRPERLAAYLPT